MKNKIKTKMKINFDFDFRFHFVFIFDFVSGFLLLFVFALNFFTRSPRSVHFLQ